MKSQKLLCLFFAVVLLASCTSDESKDILPGGIPVEVNLAFALAGAEYPQVSVTSSASATKAQSASSSVVFSGSKSSSTESSPLQVSYTAPDGATQTTASTQISGAAVTDAIQLRAGTSLSNVWVLQFDSTLTTGATTTAGTCVAAKYIGTVTTGDNLNPTLLIGTDQVIYVIANGPSASSITTSTYTLETFKSSAYFSGSITGDATVPYLGRIEGGATIEANGEIYSATSVPVITLYRIAAKISLNLNFAVTGYTLSSVQLFNAPTYMYYEYGSDITAFPETPSSSNITTTAKTANITPSTAASGTYTWYVGENKRGTSSTATSAYLKDFLHTPTDNSSYYYCTYIRIQAKKNDSTTVMNYYLYVGENGTTDFNVKRNWDYTLSATIGGNEATQQAFMGIDGRIRMATSNCYIVAPGSTITIPVNVKGNANGPLPADASSTVLAGTGLSTTHTATTVSVLWQTASGLISVGTLNTTTQTVTLTVSSSTGNGVVVATDGTNVLWSWHIWVTSYAPNSGTTGDTYSLANSATSNVFMDRNLGATSDVADNINTVGLLYQWGRKDPFPNASAWGTTEPTLYGSVTSVTKTAVSASCHLDSAIRNPVTFYYGTEANAYDWYSVTASTHNDLLWGGASYGASKTIFDPCPAGWRVPSFYKTSTSTSPWKYLAYSSSTFTYSSSGYGGSYSSYGWSFLYNSSSIGYYPAAGWRKVDSGALTGGGGNCWSASTYSSTGYYMAFGSGIVIPTNVISRAYGNSVRCVQEW